MEQIKEGYTRVSSILAIFQAYSFVPRDKLKKAQDLGTGIHEAIDSYFKYEFSPLDSRKTPHFQSFLTWAEQFNPRPLLTETRFYDDHWKITGKLDLLAMLGDEIVLIDFKTGSWAHPQIWQLQATFYRYLLTVNGYRSLPNKFMFVQLNADSAQSRIFEFDYDKKNLQVCKHALRCFQYFDRRLT